LPGQTVTPSFEPVDQQDSEFQRDLEERDFEDELDLDEDDSSEDEDDFSSRLRDEQNSAVNREQEEEDSGAFDRLKENFENLDSDKDNVQPSEEDQAAFFSNYGGN